MQGLQRELSQAQKEIEDLRARANQNTVATIESSHQEEQTISDIVADNADAIRSELIKRHDQRMAELEEEFKKRTESMRMTLSRKLTEGKAEARKTIKEESDKALEDLKTTHGSEIQALNTRHQNELDELRRSLDERFETYKTDWQANHEDNKTQSIPHAIMAQDKDQGDSLPDLSDAQVKSLVAKNETIKEIVRRNISQGIIKNKEANAVQVKQETEQEWTKRLSDAQQKFVKDKDQAVAMEAKRNTLKLSMAENKNRAAQAKIELIQTAAKDTPQRPVGEVWAVAKDAKAASVMLQTPTSKASSIIDPKALSTSTQQGTIKPSNSAASVKTESGSNIRPGATMVEPTAQRPATQVLSPGQQQESVDQEASNAPQQQIKPLDTSLAQSKPTPHEKQGQANGLPRLAQPATSNASTPRSQGPQNTVPGQASVRSLQQSGIPMARGSMRGGRGRGQGRGAPQSIDTTKTHGQSAGPGRGSPSSGRAKQFVPGNKRPREDGSDGGHGGDGKRVRGGGGGEV